MIHYLRSALTMVLVGSLLACSSSDNGADEPSSTGIDTDRYIGTWATDCLMESTAESARYVFIHTDNKTLFVTEQYSFNGNCAPESLIYADVIAGTIVFGELVVESTFGADAHEFTLTNDNDASLGENIIGVIDGTALYLGEIQRFVGTGNTPPGLDSFREYRYQGVPDLTYVDNLETQSNLTLSAESLDGLDGLNVSSLVAQASVDGVPFPLRVENTLYTGVTPVTPNSTVTVELVWSTIIDGQLLSLASFSTVVSINNVNVVIGIQPNDYFFGFDNDLDGRSNYDELRLGTDPLQP